MANALNFKLNKTAFRNIDFSKWKRLVQYIINYDVYLTQIEKLEELYLLREQLKAFLGCRGVIPSIYIDIVNDLNEKYEEAKKIRQEIEISKVDHSFKLKNQEEVLAKIEKELSQKVINKGKVIKAKRAILYFQNPYFLKDLDDQMFIKRLPSLKNELKWIEWNINKWLKPNYKKNVRMLNLIKLEFFRVLGVDKTQEKDVDKLFEFVRPYIDNIVTTKDFFYNELLALDTE